MPLPSALHQPPRSRPPTARPSSASAARAREPLFLPSSQPSEAEAELRLPAHARRDEEPLFLPGTQLSQALRESGLGLEGMTAREFEAMLEGDAEEVDFTNGDEGEGGREGSLEIVDGAEDVEMGMAPTQRRGSGKVRSCARFLPPAERLTACTRVWQAFRQLFED